MKDNKEKNIEKKPTNKKKIIKIIIIVIAIILVGGLIICLAPFLYFVAVMLYSMFIDYPAKPKEKHGEFPFELVYEYKGELVTIKDTMVCDYEGYSWSLEGGNSRDWNCEFGKDEDYGQYYIDKENFPDLYIEIPEAPDYYMGDPEETDEYTHPFIHYIDEETGTYYEETDKVDVVEVKIIEWKPSKPLKNNIK